MKQQDQQPETHSSTADKPVKAETRNRSGDGPDPDGILADRSLAKRCLAGEVKAWEEFYVQCHDPLLVSIRVMTAPYNPDPNLVDEIASQVWCALIENDGKLLARYRPQRGARLITFMRTLAKTEVRRHFRAERRRRKHERGAAREKTQHHAADAGRPMPSIEEFLATLTPSERVFYRDCLLGTAGDNANQTSPSYSSTNAWQLTHRIRKKFLKFFEYEP